MTSTSLPRIDDPDGTAGDARIHDRLPPDRSASGRLRPPARFPRRVAPPAGGHEPGPVRARWRGEDGPLLEQVRDHATAAGIELVDPAADTPVIGELVDGRTLADRGGTGARHGAPVLVVVADGAVPDRIWHAAIAAGALALVTLPSGSEHLLSHLAELARPRRSSAVIGLAGGCGGAGTSSLTARLAAAARRHGPVTLVDADPLGGGVDLLVEEPAASGIGWSEVAALGPDDGEALREGLPRVDDVHLLVAGDRPGPDAATLSRALTAMSPLGGIVVVDLAAALVPAAIPHLDRLLLVVPAGDHAVRAAARRLHTWQAPAGLVELAVRRRGPLTPGEVAGDLGLPLATAFRDGPPGAVPLLDVRRRGADRACRQLAERLAPEVAA